MSQHIHFKHKNMKDIRLWKLAAESIANIFFIYLAVIKQISTIHP